MSNLHHQSGASGASAAGLAPNRRLPPRVEARNSGCAWQVHLLNSIDTKTRTTQKRFGVSRDVAAAKNTLPNGIYSALPLSNTFIWGLYRAHRKRVCLRASAFDGLRQVPHPDPVRCKA